MAEKQGYEFRLIEGERSLLDAEFGLNRGDVKKRISDALREMPRPGVKELARRITERK